MISQKNGNFFFDALLLQNWPPCEHLLVRWICPCVPCAPSSSFFFFVNEKNEKIRSRYFFSNRFYSPAVPKNVKHHVRTKSIPLFTFSTLVFCVR